MAKDNVAVHRIEMPSMVRHLTLPALIRTKGAQTKTNSETSEAERT
ncbi:hypothetical protein MY11210_001160 [Beauveria gryllotalpidicola]